MEASTIYTTEPEFDEDFTPEEAAALLQAMRESVASVPSHAEVNAAAFAKEVTV